jgi:hypothetical protein
VGGRAGRTVWTGQNSGGDDIRLNREGVVSVPYRIEEKVSLELRGTLQVWYLCEKKSSFIGNAFKEESDDFKVIVPDPCHFNTDPIRILGFVHWISDLGPGPEPALFVIGIRNTKKIKVFLQRFFCLLSGTYFMGTFTTVFNDNNLLKEVMVHTKGLDFFACWWQDPDPCK